MDNNQSVLDINLESNNNIPEESQTDNFVSQVLQKSHDNIMKQQTILTPFLENNENGIISKTSKSLDKIFNQREVLISQLSNFQYECTICYVTLQPDIPIWSCDNCFHLVHINCIKTWHNTCINLENDKWRCPTCQKEYCLTNEEILYHCYCGKIKNPEYKRGTLMYSCGDVCGKANKIDFRCPHLCSIPCHPGPCPSCEASLTSQCHCSKTILTVKCRTSETNLICGNICLKVLNCSVHFCQIPCHSGSCDKCTETIVQSCHCKKENRIVLCGSLENNGDFYNCNNMCNKLKDCNNHRCEEICHTEPCKSCIFLPANVKYCSCGKTKLEDLVNSHSQTGDRQSCLDKIPICHEICGKNYSMCNHTCANLCHQGECSPCSLYSNIRCRCQKNIQKLKCLEIARLLSLGKAVQCSNRCKAKKTCGIHRCNESCCDKQMHICEKICGKILSCKRHSCDRICHQGNCPSCSNVSFDELFCECRMQVSLPPIACGQIPPVCSNVCSRQHACSHEVLHNCHNESQCPPCTVLTSKPCPGGHRIFYNIPCFQPVVTCGSPCNKPLSDCKHYCIKNCHTGECLNDIYKCSQLCNNPRNQCKHPCNSLCHKGDCDSVSKPCTTKVEVKCSCNYKSTTMICHKLQQFNECNIDSNKSATLNILISDKSIFLVCDADCKKAARSKQEMETFETEIQSNENVVYTSFLRDFSIRNPNFLQRIDEEFIALIRKLEVNKLGKAIHRFEPMNRDKRRFIHELSKYFGFSSSSCDSDPKRFVTVEAVRGSCKIPQNRLINFIQKNYPQLFKNEKQISLKFMIQQNSINRGSCGTETKFVNFSKNP